MSNFLTNFVCDFSAEMAGLSRCLAPVPEVRFATGTLP